MAQESMNTTDDGGAGSDFRLEPGDTRGTFNNIGEEQTTSTTPPVGERIVAPEGGDPVPAIPGI